MTNDVYIGLGSNLGESRKYLQQGLAALAALPGYNPGLLSSCYLTAPWGNENQPPFYNAVIAGSYNEEPEELLKALQSIETATGRVRQEHWGPRTLDLDILLFGSIVQVTPELSLPHREMWRRVFVLAPLEEIAADLVLPFWHKTPGQLLAALDTAERNRQVVEIVPWEG